MSLSAPLPPPQLSRGAALELRYGTAVAAPGDADWNAQLGALLERMSTRAFLAKPVSDEDLLSVVAAAQSAATSSNLQAWSVVAVRDHERKTRLASLAGHQDHILNAPLLLVFVADLARLRALEGYTGTPVAALDCFESFVASVIDTTLAAQNAVAAAHALGLGSCFIGAMRDHPEQVAETLALPPETVAVFGLVVGWPDPARASAVKPRLPAAVVLHHETYQRLDVAALDGYDTTMRHFERQHGMGEANWSDKAAERVSGPAALSGRQRLLDAVRARGFQLK
ncbi:nitroreductase family protein [Rugamonas sp.]|uniref:nitroreductase family protein n=1 Tax=Rugamonas sp. TaxID=1926287 RepID=UPI0025F86A2C|nr:nitroreductase family protein [Rugamonas sp.]